MPISVTCPGCHQVHAAPDEWAGKKVRCQHCQTRHTVPLVQPAAKPQTQPASHPAATAPTPPMPSFQPPPTPSENVPGQGRVPPARPAVPHLPQESVSPQETPADAGPRPEAFLGIMDQVFAGMGQALSVRKLSFFALSAAAALIVCGLMIVAGATVARLLGPEQMALGIGVMILMLVLAGTTATGLTGVIAGGVAFLTACEGQGRACRLPDAFRFCGERFLALFFSVLLLGFCVTSLFALANGLVGIINMNRTVGSLLGSLLFLPQAIFNAALLILLLVGVLVPCAVAVEGIGPFAAIRRLVTLLVQMPGRLLLQFGITLYFGGMMLCILVFLAIASLGPTMATNGPSVASVLPSLPSLSSNEDDPFGLLSREESGAFGFPGMKPPQSSSPRGRDAWQTSATASKGPWGDTLRQFGLAALFIAVLAFPAVFWICAFARYYESVLPSFSSGEHGRPGVP